MNEPSNISAPSFSSISNSSELSSKEEFSKIREGVSSTSDVEMDVGGSSSEVPMQQFSEHSPEHSETVVPQFPVCSYVLIGDNIDKAIKPRYMKRANNCCITSTTLLLPLASTQAHSHIFLQHLQLICCMIVVLYHFCLHVVTTKYSNTTLALCLVVF